MSVIVSTVEMEHVKIRLEVIHAIALMVLRITLMIRNRFVEIIH